MRKWISEATKGNRGKLHSQLGIPSNQRIPKTLLQTITSAKAGQTIVNPTNVGRRRYKVTRLLEQRSQFALNVGYKKRG